MKRLLLSLLLLCCFLCGGALVAQPGKVYRSLKEVKDPSQVYILHLSWKHLRAIPPVVFEMTNLEELDLHRNRIDSIPPQIAQLSHLKRLNLGRNSLYTLPLEVGLLTSLEELDLSRNPIDTLPDELAFLTSLRKLVLWSTQINALSPQFSALDATLQVLDMRDCPLNLDDQHRIHDILPTPRKLWDQACNCD